MKLHLVSGFLGSGKTTAIAQAAKSLMSRGKTVGVITNDQGKYLVDTAFFKLDDIPTVEVTGGCFCCNYDDLDARLDQLIETAHPDVIFAESVGSCADLVATVIKPLMNLRLDGLPPQSFSVFSDIRLLQLRLDDEIMPFSEDVVYIFDKQIEESEILVINKKDLVSKAEAANIFDLAQKQFPRKKIILQNSFISEEIGIWLDILDTYHFSNTEPRLDIDYQRYGNGEAQLAWVDEEIHVTFQQSRGKEIIQDLIEAILLTISQSNAPIGHLKFLIRGDQQEFKLSFPTIEENNWKNQIPSLNGSEVLRLLNARIEMDAKELQDRIHQSLQEIIRKTGVEITVSGVDYFHPKYPNPTHRYS